MNYSDCLDSVVFRNFFVSRQEVFVLPENFLSIDSIELPDFLEELDSRGFVVDYDSSNKLIKISDSDRFKQNKQKKFLLAELEKKEKYNKLSDDELNSLLDIRREAHFPLYRLVDLKYASSENTQSVHIFCPNRDFEIVFKNIFNSHHIYNSPEDDIKMGFELGVKATVLYGGSNRGAGIGLIYSALNLINDFFKPLETQLEDSKIRKLYLERINLINNDQNKYIPPSDVSLRGLRKSARCSYFSKQKKESAQFSEYELKRAENFFNKLQKVI
ncbi:hypothetical protein K9L97_02445 [Candidatus Woesearchaeota archaeon]|nr:hypothetical protein [Candidatus Woesearchaeota archaeon]